MPASFSEEVPLIVSPPFLSTDVFRYVWDGRVQADGIARIMSLAQVRGGNSFLSAMDHGLLCAT